MGRWPVVALLALAALAVPSQAGTPTGPKARVKQGVKAEVKRGTLAITGNRRANRVTLRLRRGRPGTLEVDVRSNGSADFRFRRRAFRRIVLRGGRGNDTLAVSERNGSFIRSERTTFDGGRGRDRLVFTGSNGADSISLSGSRGRVRVARGAGRATGAGATFTLAAGSLERVSVNPLGGDDTIALADLRGTRVVSLALQLGSGTRSDGDVDTVAASGTAAPDVLVVAVDWRARSVAVGGIGPTVAAANLEPGEDRVTVNGLGGADTLHVTGSNVADIFDVRAAGGQVHTNVAGTPVESDDVESLRLNPLGGADTAALGNVEGTDLGQIAVDLGAASTGPPDGQADALTVLASGGADNIAVGGNSSGIAITGLATPVSVVGTDAGDQLAVNGLGGADTINSSGLAAGTALLTIRGGPDGDTLTGGPSDETFAWDPGDGSDLLEGGAGTDTAAANGSDAAENFAVVPGTPGRLLLMRDVETPFDMNDVEAASVTPGGGADFVNMPDLAGAELTNMAVNLAPGDGEADNVTVSATNNPDVIPVTPVAGGVTVAVAPAMTVTGAELGEDFLSILGLGGDDTFNASTVPAGLVDLVMQGGLGEDIFIGSEGSDFVDGDDGDDVGLLGAGNDTFVWSPGDDNDTIEGQAGSDKLLFNGSAAAETITIVPNGGRMLFLRDIANVTMDCNDVEIVDFNALGGADSITVNNMTGTDLSQVNLALAAAGGAGDAQPDSVTLNGTNGNDVVSLTGAPNVLNVTGLIPSLTVSGAEAANDRLTLNALLGNDTVDASGVAAGAMLLTLNGDAGNDSLTGGGGNDTINGGADDDFIRGGPGIDALDGGTGTNTVIQD